MSMAESRTERRQATSASARGELLSRLLQQEGIDLPGGQATAKRPAGERALSFSQERLWFLDQLYPGRAVYNIGRALRLKGALDPNALGEAIHAIVQRHEILRSNFSGVNGNPV